ncbi:MFS transporter [Pedobacter yulinensis]|uniref:MFS transporter n=1 Tax=Pedobacter yulinensis TaxID=2126353 RepID=A0A2T3HPQ1_9SPHI|nr:MFS transporter [Pedobacter yulinensis]PST84424.1 MFS transporter [Pedobacter yulinensis]
MFRSFRYYNYRLHFSGQALSLIGTWMQRVAISWLVYRVTGSAFMLGLVGFLGLIPSLVLAPFAGAFADRNNKYKIVLWCQVAFMAQAGMLALLTFSGNYNMVLISLLSLMQGVVSTFETTGRQSLVAELIGNRDDLPNALALNSSAFNAARLLGPALAGIVLSTFGENACFLINFLSFIPVITCLLFMRLEPYVPQTLTGNTWHGLKEGFRYLERTHDISSLIVVLALSSLLVIPFSTLLPVFAKDIFSGDATTFSWFESAGGLGALIGAVYMARLKGAKKLRTIVIGANLIFALGVIFLSFSPTLWMALIFTAMACTGLMTQNAAINTYIQTHAAPEMRGRAISYYIMAFQGVLPVGTLLIATAAHFFGTQATVLAEGLIGLLIIGLYGRYLRKKKSMEKGRIIPMAEWWRKLAS